mmetsp:Transcript_45066/g.109040  ORF Transcript_45066/g.109040 Transcript_45066/m.109040 type:complete len:87 (-) Transcript_45066:220-480(-)
MITAVGQNDRRRPFSGRGAIFLFFEEDNALATDYCSKWNVKAGKSEALKRNIARSGMSKLTEQKHERECPTVGLLLASVVGTEVDG